MKQKLAMSITQILLSTALSLLIASLFSFYIQIPSRNGTQTVVVNTAPVAVRVNINTATKAELETLPYIGGSLANEIIQARPYGDVWELSDIAGIGGIILKNIIDKVEV